MSNFRATFLLSLAFFFISALFSNAFAQYGCGPYGCTPTPVPTWFIDAYVFSDSNRDGEYQGGEPFLWNQTVYLDGAPQDTDVGGYTRFYPVLTGWHTLSYTPPSGYQATTPTSHNLYVGPSRTRYFGVAIPPTPIITPNPPTTSCSGNNPVVSFTYSSSGAQWYKVFSEDSPATPLYDGASTSFSETLGTSYNNRQNYDYTVRAYYNTNPGPSDAYSSATTTEFNLPNCYYAISGNVYVDLNRNGVKDGSDTNYAGATVSLTGNSPTTTNGSGNYSFGTLLGGNYTLTLTVPTDHVATSPNPATYSFTPLAGIVTTANFGIVPVYTTGDPPSAGSNGTVYVDQDRSSSYTAGDTGYSGSTLTLTGTLTYGNPAFASQSTTSTANGTYIFPNPATAYLYEGDYTVTFTNPDSARYQSPAQMAGSFHLPPDTTGPSFGIIPRYQISGNVFNDLSKDGIKNGVEPNMTSGAEYTIEIRGPVNLDLTTTNGAYTTGTTLYEGQYTVTYTSAIPDEYRMTNPENCVGNCLFTVTVGRNCTVNSAVGASCISAGLQFTASDVQNLNFGMTNYIPWFQCIGNSCRIDGTIDNDGSTQTGFADPIPSTALLACGGANASIPGLNSPQPGIIFSGGTTYFGQGQASTPQNWVVNDSTYSPTLIRTSYGYMTTTLRQSGITPIDLASVCTLGNCTLPADLANGVYLANGDVILNAYTFPAGKIYVILINGDLTIVGEIHIPVGSAATFSVAGDIIIDSSIGVGIGNFCSQTANVEGFFSADGSFIIEGIGDCNLYSNPLTRDQRFNLAGGIVVNAGQSGGSIQNQRDLCDDDRSAPVFSIIARPDFLLNVPEFIKYRSDVWREVAP